MKKGTILSFAFLLVFGLLLAACGSSQSSNGSGGNSSDNSKANSDGGSGKVILVGADTTFPPFETQDANGNITGFDIEMIKDIAKAEGFKVKLKPMQFDGIIPALQGGSIDAAVAGITIKKDRMKHVNFSNAYYKSGLSILVKKDSDISGVDSLKGHLIGTKKGTSSVSYLEQNGFNVSKNVKQYKNISEAYAALESGGVDAVLFDNPPNINFANQHDDVKLVGGLLTGEYYGIAVTKKNQDLLKKINDGLAKIKKNGEYKKLFKKYLGGDMNGFVKGVKKPEKVAVTD
ncbi:MAG TPA: basic amino acid ABC transporter substrate-binding protein [Bacillales bacterium]|nr:basic amino acid ABC transporter substrate-binding protein [Bacillales bacterium]